MAGSNLISSDAPLTEPQRAAARAITDLIIPASDDGRLPSASEYDVIGYVARSAPERMAAIQRDIATLEQSAQQTYARSFNELDAGAQAKLTDAHRFADEEFLRELAVSTTIFYYQQDKVLEALGMEARPPYPQGHTVKSGDLTLLNPVRERGRIYREIDQGN